jgi:hypothetical protein
VEGMISTSVIDLDVFNCFLFLHSNTGSQKDKAHLSLHKKRKSELGPVTE